MAHMVETMAYAGAVPWHGLGKPVPADLSTNQMLDAAGLNWTVEKVPLYYMADAKKNKVFGKEALIRSSDNTLLDVVGSDWNPLQNSEAFEFFNDFVMAGDMEMHTAGALENGRRVWALAKVKDSFEVFKNDKIDQYLLLSNPHKYGQSIDVRMTPIRVVCNNTLTLALDSNVERMVKINHRQVFDADYVKETLGVAKEKLESYKEAAKFLGSKRYTEKTIMDYFQKVFPTNSKKEEAQQSRNATTAMEVLHTQPGAKYGEGTWWQGFNTVTYMTDHLLGRSTDTRLTSSWFGINRKKKIDALELAVEMAEAA